MLTSPQSLTINAVANELNRIEDDKTSSVYANADGTLKFKVSHQESKSRIRRMVRLDKTVVASDPLTAENAYQRAGTYLVIEEPEFGFNDAELESLVKALTGWLTTANILAVLASRH